ncbi:MAG: LysR family transcriptional regulator [Serpentinimonas sp.]|nr:LysR family transcriptional regulator [Serpentinimonas sp.]
MKDQTLFDKIDLHLIRVLHTVLTERSVSRTAVRLGMHQPAVSAALRRLRELANDPLLVRSGGGMVPTAVALRMIEPAGHILRSAEVLFSASDYLDPLFLPRLVARLKAEAPLCPIEIRPLSADSDYQRRLAEGEVDVVIGNWPQPPEDLHLGRLFGDEVVSLVAQHHPAVRRGWDAQAWLQAEHIAPTPTHPGARGVIDDHLASQGLSRHIAARCPHFGLIPAMVASSLLVLTTGRQYCERFLNQLPLAILPCPVPFPRMMYYQLWHERSHASPAAQWLRQCIKQVASELVHTPTP